MSGYSDNGLILQIGGNTAGATSVLRRGLVELDGGPNITISQNGSTLVFSGGAGGGGGSVNFSAGTTSNNLNSVVFGNGGGVSFGLNGSTITGAAPAQTVQTQNLVTLNGSTGNLTISAGNLISISNNASTISVINLLSSATTVSSVGSANAIGAMASRFALEGHIHAGVGAIAAGSNTGTTLGNTASQHGTWVVAASGNITASGSTGGAGVHTVWLSVPNSAAQSNQQMTLFATGNTTQSSTGTTNASSIIFRGSGAASVGITNGSILIDVAAGAAAITQSVGMSTQTAGGATAGTAGYVTGDDILYHLVPGSNITMSQSINGASGTLSIYGPAAAGANTFSGWSPYADFVKITGQAGQGTLQIDPQRVNNAVQFDRVVLPIFNTNSSNSSGSHTLSFWVGIYSRNASSLSLAGSTSSSTAVTHSGTAGSYSFYSGQRLFTIPFTSTLTQADYWIAVVSRTTSGGANGSYSQMLNSNIASNFLGHFGSSHATTAQLTLGQGVYTATTSGIPASIAFTQIRGSDSMARRAVHIMFASGTV